jgi:hypothetical protein
MEDDVTDRDDVTGDDDDVTAIEDDVIGGVVSPLGGRRILKLTSSVYR